MDIGATANPWLAKPVGDTEWRASTCGGRQGSGDEGTKIISAARQEQREITLGKDMLLESLCASRPRDGARCRLPLGVGERGV
jgi:hypothetical protein